MDDIRSGRHDCFDRIVVDLDGPITGYTASYVDEVIVEGSPLPLRGGAFIDLRVNAPNYDATGTPTYNPPGGSEVVSVAGYRTLRQVSLGQSFDDQLQIGIGVRARLPFHVSTLDGPGNGSRVVIDIGHRWYPEQPPASRTVQVFHNTGDGMDCSETTGYPRDATGVVAPIGFALDQLVAGPTAEEPATRMPTYATGSTSTICGIFSLKPVSSTHRNMNISRKTKPGLKRRIKNFTPRIRISPGTSSISATVGFCDTWPWFAFTKRRG